MDLYRFVVQHVRCSSRPWPIWRRTQLDAVRSVAVSQPARKHRNSHENPVAPPPMGREGLTSRNPSHNWGAVLSSHPAATSASSAQSMLSPASSARPVRGPGPGDVIPRAKRAQRADRYGKSSVGGGLTVARPVARTPTRTAWGLANAATPTPMATAEGRTWKGTLRG